MKLTKKKYILTLSLLFVAICKFISSIFCDLPCFLNDFTSKMSTISDKLSNEAAIFSFSSVKNFKNLIKGSGLWVSLSNEALNTATVYINGSNHNLVYTASACRLHPGPTLYKHHAIWQTKRAGK